LFFIFAEGIKNPGELDAGKIYNVDKLDDHLLRKCVQK